eukprot:CAMPEP_0180134008 /NCGR_PEP_ID=MMETSP0986-20121125/9881_1 /TAXON_ID=697907 /ORGANISM="non described non described, Strain CCMP2293" /LENGTH=56 /DNA_ID=CAMNT_0022074237 /DNA_START=50 /DNA_END=220 /DNA_ORIENTATION=+
MGRLPHEEILRRYWICCEGHVPSSIRRSPPLSWSPRNYPLTITLTIKSLPQLYDTP